MQNKLIDERVKRARKKVYRLSCRDAKHDAAHPELASDTVPDDWYDAYCELQDAIDSINN